ncbi:MAG: Sua5/YciO/YrdC/YwlC family protein [Patescibacteria group bacterium]
MKVYKINQIKQIAKEIKNGSIAVLPTDTIYGICSSALNKKSVEKVYELKKRDYNKPSIILISKIDDLKKFGIRIDKKLSELLNSIWPNRISVVLRCDNKKVENDLSFSAPKNNDENDLSFLSPKDKPFGFLAFNYLHRGVKSLAFRIPSNQFLLKLLNKTGPIIAPSANPQGKKLSNNIQEAIKYFNDAVIYIDGGKLKSSASCLISIERNFDIKILRNRAVSGNKYFLMRHGEAIANERNIISSYYPERFKNSLTKRGEQQVLKKIEQLKKYKIDLIVASPFLRTKQTAKIISEKLKIPVIYDKRLKEINCGIFEGQDWTPYNKFAKKIIDRYKNRIPKGESLRDVKIRMLKVIFELEKKYQNKTILIVSHGHPLLVLYGAMQGYSETEVSEHKNWDFNLTDIKKAKIFNYNAEKLFSVKPFNYNRLRKSLHFVMKASHRK